MKFRILNNTLDHTDFDVVTEDGGVANIYFNGDNFVTTYYQNRIKDLKDDELWDYLADGKSYSKDWDEGTNLDTMIIDALAWLVTDSQDWEKDETLFSELFS